MRFPLSLTIDTPRCRLRAVSLADIPAIFEATRVRGFTDGMLWEPPATPDELIAPYQAALAAWEEDRGYAFSLETLADATFLGRTILRQDDHPAAWNLGFWTHPSHQGQGYMTEAARALVAFAFTQLDAQIVEASCADWNHPSARVLQKAGLRYLRHAPDSHKKNGTSVSEDLYAISLSQWLDTPSTDASGTPQPNPWPH